MKQARSEGNKVASLIKANKAEFYIADVDLEDDCEAVKLAAETAIKTLGKQKSAFMIISAGVKNITVYVYAPEELENKIDVSTWLNTSIADIQSGNKKHESDSMIVIEADTPFKLKDVVRSKGFSYLTENGFIKVESDEEFIGFDDL